MKPIFNSLGSNYDFSFACRALFFLLAPGSSARTALSRELESRFGGEAHLLYKGRDAIQCALEGLGIGRGDGVLTQALTCYAIEEAILRTGAIPVFVDIEKDHLNLSVATLQHTYGRAHTPRAVIVQNTLGVPADMEEIKKWCSEKKLVLIEDLAQSIGAVSSTGKMLGSYGDAVVLSFGRDKIVDAVSGGAVIFRRPANHKIETSGRVHTGTIIKDMIYPALTWKIRKTHRILLGKIILRLFRNVGLMTSAVASPTATATPMPAPHARLTLYQWHKLDEGLAHRRKIGQTYLAHLNEKANILTSKQIVEQGANLRLPMVVENPDDLIKHLSFSNIYLADRWYRSPVDCGNLPVKSIYKQGTCPNAEKLSRTVVNLPTHINVGEKDAVRIANAVNNYLK